MRQEQPQAPQHDPETEAYTCPRKVPAPLRDELIKLMMVYVDSELASAAGFVSVINRAPGLRERMTATRIVHEKFQCADRVLEVLATFGVDPDAFSCKPSLVQWLHRGADVRPANVGDMRMSALNYPLTGWTDAVTMNYMMGQAALLHLEEYARVFYQPLAEVFADNVITEDRHVALAREGLTKLITCGERDGIQASLTYWWPRVLLSFPPLKPPKFQHLRRVGLRHRTNETLRKIWATETRGFFDRMRLVAPMEI